MKAVRIEDLREPRRDATEQSFYDAPGGAGSQPDASMVNG
jgi:hypothetical protein